MGNVEWGNWRTSCENFVSWNWWTLVLSEETEETADPLIGFDWGWWVQGFQKKIWDTCSEIYTCFFICLNWSLLTINWSWNIFTTLFHAGVPAFFLHQLCVVLIPFVWVLFGLPRNLTCRPQIRLLLVHRFLWLSLQVAAWQACYECCWWCDGGPLKWLLAVSKVNTVYVVHSTCMPCTDLAYCFISFLNAHWVAIEFLW